MEDTTEAEASHAAATQPAPRWQARPGLALVLRLAITLGPLVLVSFTAWQVHLWLGPPSSAINGVARWIALSAAGTVVIQLLDRFAKRLLPLTVLLRMSIVFPDDVPSRFRVAMRYGSTRQLARDIANDSLDDATPQEAAEKLIGLVSQLSNHDRATRGHTERVRAYADLVAAEMGFSNEEREKLHWAGLLHDIGKLSVPAAILNKRTPLTDREWAQLQLHPNEGWALVEPLRPWLGEWARSTRDHHEFWDGSGYPRKLKGPEISRGGRIIAVVDAFDVMTSQRSYKESISYDEARSELARCSEAQFDPDVVRAFLALSLSKRRRGWGVLNWLANSPIITSVGSSGSVPATVLTSVAATAIAAGTILVPLVDLRPTEDAVERVVVTEPTSTLAPPTSTTAAVPSTSRAPESTTTTTSTTTTVAPTTIAPTTTTAVVTTAAPTTVAPTTVPPPTTTAGSSFATGYLGGGFSDVLNLIPSVDGGTTLNVDNDGNPGLTIPRSPDGLIEISSASVRAWSSTITEDTVLRGQATLRLYVATAGFTDGFGVVLAGLVECEQPSSVCTTIATGQGGFAQVGFGNGFGELEIYLGSIDYTVPAGRHLLITVAVPESSTHDVWVEFGSPSHPSQFLIS